MPTLVRTHIRYGDVDLVNCLTDSFSQEPVYDESGTDLLYYKYVVAVTCYVHGDTSTGNISSYGAQPPSVSNDGPAIINNGIDGGTNYISGVGLTTGDSFAPAVGAASGATLSTQHAVWNYRTLRAALGQPRQPFQMWVGDNQILRGAPAWGSSQTANAAKQLNRSTDDIDQHDLCNGPKITRCEIESIQGPAIFRVQWTVELCLLHCFPGSTNYGAIDSDVGKAGGPRRGNQVLSNRWSVIDTVDGDMQTTRTFTGILRAATANINPNAFRRWVVPVLSYGYRIFSMTFETSPDGMTLNYTIVHKEIEYSAPYPATTWDFEWTLTTGDGMLGEAEGSVRLKGDRTVSKGVLIQLGLTILESRLRWDSANAPGRIRHLIEHLSITDSYGSSGSEVRISARVKLTGGDHAQRIAGNANFPIPLPAQHAFQIMGIPISDNDIGAFISGYNKNYSRGALGSQWNAGTSPPAAPTGGPQFVGHPTQGVLTLAMAFSCAVKLQCDSLEGDSYNHRGAWWINSHASTDTGVGDGPSGEASAREVDVLPTWSDMADSDSTSSTEHYKYTTEHLDNLYRFNHATAFYDTPQMRLQVPAAGFFLSPIGAAVCTISLLSNPQSSYNVRVTSQRLGEHPQVPEMKDQFTDLNGIVYTLIDSSFELLPPVIGPHLLTIYRFDCNYVYAMSRPIDLSKESIRTPPIPWLERINDMPHEQARTSIDAGKIFTLEQ